MAIVRQDTVSLAARLDKLDGFLVVVQGLVTAYNALGIEDLATIEEVQQVYEDPKTFVRNRAEQKVAADNEIPTYGGFPVDITQLVQYPDDSTVVAAANEVTTFMKVNHLTENGFGYSVKIPSFFDLDENGDVEITAAGTALVTDSVTIYANSDKEIAAAAALADYETALQAFDAYLKSAGIPAGLKNYRNRGLFSTNPRTGDIEFPLYMYNELSKS